MSTDCEVLVSVVGSTNTHATPAGCGVGKSALISRFLRPSVRHGSSETSYFSELFDHDSTITSLDFSDPTVNGDQFLFHGSVTMNCEQKERATSKKAQFWARATRRMRKERCKVNIIEQTTFRDDCTGRPFTVVPYLRRASAVSVKSNLAGKLAYSRRSSIGDEEEADRAAEFPRAIQCGKQKVSGFLLVVDIAAGEESLCQQERFLTLFRLALPRKAKTVLVATKCDRLIAPDEKNDGVAPGFKTVSLSREAVETARQRESRVVRLAKKLGACGCVFASAKTGLNVSLAFRSLLAAILEQPQPEDESSYLIASALLSERKAENMMKLARELSERVADFSTTWHEVQPELARSSAPYRALAEIDCSDSTAFLIFKHRLLDLLTSKHSDCCFCGLSARRRVIDDLFGGRMKINELETDDQTFREELQSHPDIRLVLRLSERPLVQLTSKKKKKSVWTTWHWQQTNKKCSDPRKPSGRNVVFFLFSSPPLHPLLYTINILSFKRRKKTEKTRLDVIHAHQQKFGWRLINHKPNTCWFVWL